MKIFKQIRVYAANATWMGVEKILSMVATFFITVLIARHLGPRDFGVISYALSLVAMFSVAGHAGLSGLVIRELVKDPKSEHEIMGSTLAMKATGYALGGLSLVAFIMLTEPSKSSELYVTLILALVLFIQPLLVVDYWFQSRLQAKFIAISTILALGLACILKVVFVYLDLGVVFFALANVVQASLYIAIATWFFFRQSGSIFWQWRFSLARARSLFSQAWLVFLGSIFATVYLKVDQVMLKHLRGAEEVGTYAVAAKLSEAWYFFPAAIVVSVFPRLIELKDESPDVFKYRLQQLFDFLFLAALIIAVFVTFFAQPLVVGFFGNAYSSSASILVVHIWAAIFIFMRAAFSKWILIENLLSFSLITQGLGAFVNILLNFYLIPRFGGLGAAYATLLSYATASYFVLIFYGQTRPIFIMMTYAIFSPFRWFLASRGPGEYER